MIAPTSRRLTSMVFPAGPSAINGPSMRLLPYYRTIRCSRHSFVLTQPLSSFAQGLGPPLETPLGYGARCACCSSLLVGSARKREGSRPTEGRGVNCGRGAEDSWVTAEGVFPALGPSLCPQDSYSERGQAVLSVRGWKQTGLCQWWERSVSCQPSRLG